MQKFLRQFFYCLLEDLDEEKENARHGQKCSSGQVGLKRARETEYVYRHINTSLLIFLRWYVFKDAGDTA